MKAPLEVLTRARSITKIKEPLVFSLNGFARRAEQKNRRSPPAVLLSVYSGRGQKLA